MENSLIVETCTIIASIGAVFGAWAKWLCPLFARWRSRKSVVSGIKQLHSLHEIMSRIQKDSGDDRVIIFSGHNSGGVPRAGSPFYASAMHWKLREDDDRANMKIADYQNLRVDSDYINMLIQVCDIGYYHFDPDIEPDCLLKKLYIDEGVTDSFIVYLSCIDGNLIYLSSARFGGKFSNSEKERVKILAQAAQKILL